MLTPFRISRCVDFSEQYQHNVSLCILREEHSPVLLALHLLRSLADSSRVPLSFEASREPVRKEKGPKLDPMELDRTIEEGKSDSWTENKLDSILTPSSRTNSSKLSSKVRPWRCGALIPPTGLGQALGLI